MIGLPISIHHNQSQLSSYTTQCCNRHPHSFNYTDPKLSVPNFINLKLQNNMGNHQHISLVQAWVHVTKFNPIEEAGRKWEKEGRKGKRNLFPTVFFKGSNGPKYTCIPTWPFNHQPNQYFPLKQMQTPFHILESSKLNSTIIKPQGKSDKFTFLFTNQTMTTS